MEAYNDTETSPQIYPEFKLQVLAEITAGKSVAQAAREHQLHPTLIGRWQIIILLHIVSEEYSSTS